MMTAILLYVGILRKLIAGLKNVISLFIKAALQIQSGAEGISRSGSGKEKGRLERRPSVEVLRDVAVYGR